MEKDYKYGIYYKIYAFWVFIIHMIINFGVIY